MNERQAVEAVIESMDRPPPKKEDPRPFWQRLLSSIRPSVTVKCSGSKPNVKVEIKGGAEF